jgi:hypothetical protein
LKSVYLSSHTFVIFSLPFFTLSLLKGQVYGERLDRTSYEYYYNDYESYKNSPLD